MSLIIGIDPGSRMTGYGIIDTQGDKLAFLDAGTIRTDSSDMPTRIAQIFSGVTRIVAHYQKYSDKPMHAAIEQVFMASNPDSALKLGQARGAAIAALTALDLTVSEYTARQIKQAVCGYGAAGKEQVSDMVCRLLSLTVVPQADAADGLACAICHAHSSHSMSKLLGNSAFANRSTSKKKGRWRLSEEDALMMLKR
ncbi:crossover junction endodeoxyribonuclease RuvC [Moraxella caviae]|uniref:Crossover junction endodeoxyribonuclease RuvC n=1 Tax=Moraxella caviae TaxID=34060 RepID=A0A1S9ZZU5_9GAMM|nr:crossover junction endodeoxyribonuclease RuvC [Moraxella caviae]OOR88461.1 crossover junction endodeoxyribonuclease RuvC [Moraxella caviae]STZ14353.1 Crossover junction endodeoxyribonuclease RuvC [Moraxella caviae]VEW10316.1 Crossover junction endodeoxyribonuclease RuvC [Moraxella caviae]